MFALAGLRIGYLCGSLPVMEMISRTCVVYSVNTLVQEAALLATLEDADAHVAATRAHMPHKGISCAGRWPDWGLPC